MTRVAVVGLGKIGLPLAALYAGKGASVIGCDIDARVVDAVNAGVSPIQGEPGLEEAVRRAHESGLLQATSDTAAAVAASEVVLLIVRVGLDEDRQADYSQLDAAAREVAKGLQPGTLVILETTVPVSATRQHLGRVLQEASGLAPDELLLAYSPERVSSGSIFRDLATYPKLVGGVNMASTAAAEAFYKSVLDAPITVLPDTETAEFTKLAESVYRDVNIALANELARAAEAAGVDYGIAALAANSQPYSHLHSPGLGVGGHCIPVYPYFLMSTADQPIVALSRQVNDAMAEHGVARLEQALGGLEGRSVLILGLAYRGGVKEATLSSAILVAQALQAKGAHALVHDPLFTPQEIAGYGLQASLLPPEGPIDAVILQAMHDEYRDLDLATLKGCRVFLDGRGAFDRARVEAAGMRYMAIGAPD